MTSTELTGYHSVVASGNINFISNLPSSYDDLIRQTVDLGGSAASQFYGDTVNTVVITEFTGTYANGFNVFGSQRYNGSLENIPARADLAPFFESGIDGYDYLYLNTGSGSRREANISRTLSHEMLHDSPFIQQQTAIFMAEVARRAPGASAMDQYGRLTQVMEHVVISYYLDLIHGTVNAFTSDSNGTLAYVNIAQKALDHLMENGSLDEYTGQLNDDVLQRFLSDTESNDIVTIDQFQNGGVASYVNQNGQFVVTAENSRYTENMLNNYGTEHVNSDGVLEGGMTFGATMRAFADWIGLDGTLGIQDSFARDDEGSAAAGTVTDGVGGDSGSQTSGTNNSTNSDSNNDSSGNGFVDAVNAVGAGIVHVVNSIADFVGLDGSLGFDGTYNNPILLDLDGNGIQLTDLTRSTVFMEGEEGLKHRTAWAGAGDGVLFYDTDGDDKISDIREYVFTEWDPTAKDDLAALRSRFDTNGDGKLTGAELNGFKVMVTGANGALTAMTLAELGITQINLTEDTTHIEMPDGSVITGQGLSQTCPVIWGNLMLVEAQDYV